MRENNQTSAQVADALGVSTRSVFRYISGDKNPNEVSMRKLEDLTRGEVTRLDFIGDCTQTRIDYLARASEALHDKTDAELLSIITA